MTNQVPLPSAGGRYVFDGYELVQVEASTAAPLPKSQRPVAAADQAEHPDPPADPAPIA